VALLMLKGRNLCKQENFQTTSVKDGKSWGLFIRWVTIFFEKNQKSGQKFNLIKSKKFKS
jgi:hypothetical protein